MTREEAIEILRHPPIVGLYAIPKMKESLEMAIEALETIDRIENMICKSIDEFVVRGTRL